MPLAGSVIGREHDLDRIERFLGGAREDATILVLEGDPGIGKSTLWRAGVERARGLGFRILEARPAAPERELAFTVLRDLLLGLEDEIGSLPAPQRRALRIALILEEAKGQPLDQSAIGAGVLELLRRLSTERLLLVALDDLQWADGPSAAVLRFALRRLDDHRVRVLATSRTNSESEIPLDGNQRVPVGPLPVEALDQLVRERLGARFLRPVVRRLAQVSGGNPLYALEVAAALLRSGRDVEPGEELPVPGRLREIIRRRLAALTPDAREAALATAALAHPTVAVVEAAVAGGRAAILDAVAVGVLDEDCGTLGFTHPLFATVVYEDSALADRRSIHRRLGAIVDDPEEQARQLAEGAEGPDETVAAAVERAAAGVATRGAPESAVRLAKRAVDLTPTEHHVELHKRRLDCANYSLAAGDPKHAETLLEDQLALAPPGRERAEVEFALGKARLATRGIAAAQVCYERAVRELENTDELELRATVLVELGDTQLRDDVWRHSETAAQALALAEEVGKPDLLARALGLQGETLCLRGGRSPDAYWRRALEIERATGELRYGGPGFAYAVELFFYDDFEPAAEHLREVAESMRRRGDPMLPHVLLLMSDVARAAGRWDEAARQIEEAHRVVIQTGRASLETECLLHEARLALLRGDLDHARERCDEAMAKVDRLATSEPRLASWDGVGSKALAASLLGRIEAASEHHAEAHTWFARDLEILRQFGFREFLAESLADDIASLVALDALDEGARELAELRELTKALGRPWLDALEARAAGLLEAGQANLDSALRHLERSRDLLEELQSPWPFELGRTLLALGTVQRRMRQKLPARQTLEQALGIFERLGARLWAEKTRAELGRISGRPSRPGALTPIEQSIARAVAEGRSNAEVAQELFISAKTVEWNLSKIYKKLHVGSRTELAAKLAKKAAVSR